MESSPNTCSICRVPLLRQVRNASLSCGHIFHRRCIEDLVRLSRYLLHGSSILTEGTAIDCPNCRRATVLSSISTLQVDANSYSLPSVHWHDYITLHPRQIRAQDILYALRDNILGICWPFFIPPDGWGLCVLDYRARLRQHQRPVSRSLCCVPCTRTVASSYSAGNMT